MDPRAPWNLDRKVCIGSTTSFAGSFVTAPFPFHFAFFPSSSYPSSFDLLLPFFDRCTQAARLPYFFTLLTLRRFTVRFQWRFVLPDRELLQLVELLTSLSRDHHAFVRATTKFDCNSVQITQICLLLRAFICNPRSHPF